MPGDEKDHNAPRALDAAELDRLYRLGLALRFEQDDRRELLLAGLPREYVATLPTARSRGDRLRNDLLELNTTKPLEGATHRPIASWLKRAVQIAAQDGRAERAELEQLCAVVLGRPPRPAPTSTSPTEVLVSHGVRLRPGAAPLPRHIDAPSRLLIARHQVVAFSGQAAELAELSRWADDEAKVAVRLIYGPGGIGKTRLAQEWIRLRRSEGKFAGFLPDDLTDALIAAILGLDDADIVVDYAESRTRLGELLQRSRSVGRAPTAAEFESFFWRATLATGGISSSRTTPALQIC